MKTSPPAAAPVRFDPLLLCAVAFEGSACAMRPADSKTIACSIENGDKLPAALRARAALRTARSLVRQTYPGSRAIVRVRRDDLVPPAPEVLLGLAQAFGDQLVLARKRAIQAHLGGTGLLRDRVDPDRRLRQAGRAAGAVRRRRASPRKAAPPGRPRCVPSRPAIPRQRRAGGARPPVVASGSARRPPRPPGWGRGCPRLQLTFRPCIVPRRCRPDGTRRGCRAPSAAPRPGAPRWRGRATSRATPRTRSRR